MKSLFHFMLAGFIACILDGCASLAYLPGQKAIGTLQVLGPHVFVNEMPAVNGQTIVSDDHITTGKASSAVIHFFSGGLIQLDENTDPGFKLVWDQTHCIFFVFKHLVGQAYEETSPECSTNYQAAHGSWKNHGTQFNISVSKDQSVMTVLAGTMELLSPKSMLQSEGLQMIVSNAGVQSMRRLAPDELKKITRWREKFPISPSPGSDGGGSKNACQCAD